MENIKSVLEKFYLENRENDLIKTKDEIISSINSNFSFLQAQSQSIKSKINLNDIIFGIEDYLIFTEHIFIVTKLGTRETYSYNIIEFLKIGGKPKSWTKTGQITFENKELTKVRTMKNDLFDLFNRLKILINEYLNSLENIKLQKENLRIKNLYESQNNVLKEFDNDGNGEIDIVDGTDFNNLLKKHQAKIIEIDKNYILKFVRISSYIKTKKENIQTIFSSIKETENQTELNEFVGILKNEIHNYNIVLYSSLSMITSLIKEDMITFYEIYESFDKLNIFNSNWENEVSIKLNNIGEGINSLMYTIQEMGDNIVSELGNLSYVTEDLNESVVTQLKEVESSVNANNLLSGIQSYQLYKINKNTKNLN